MRVVDLDNDGSIDTLVMCSVPGAFAIHSQRNDNSRKIENFMKIAVETIMTSHLPFRTLMLCLALMRIVGASHTKR